MLSYAVYDILERPEDGDNLCMLSYALYDILVRLEDREILWMMSYVLCSECLEDRDNPFMTL